jgi:hypothetical protein
MSQTYHIIKSGEGDSLEFSSVEEIALKSVLSAHERALLVLEGGRRLLPGDRLSRQEQSRVALGQQRWCVVGRRRGRTVAICDRAVSPAEIAEGQGAVFRSAAVYVDTKVVWRRPVSRSTRYGKKIGALCEKLKQVQALPATVAREKKATQIRGRIARLRAKVSRVEQGYANPYIWLPTRSRKRRKKK